MLTHLSLFTGIAGFELGMKLAGLDFQTVGYCEIEEYCQQLIQARIRDGLLDDAPIFPDIRTFPCNEYQGLVDIVTGGFPCQDISVTGKGAGIHGERSGLWWEMWRCISQLRPSYVILENVPAILVRGGVEVIGSLASIGYDCEWHIVSAADVGAPHLRKRWWCVATDARRQSHERSRMGDAADNQFAWDWAPRNWRRQPTDASWWTTEPNVGRVAHGIPQRVDRLKALGNAVVPAVVAKFLAAIKETP